MYKLFYSPGACSLAVHVALKECGAPFEAINTSISEGKNKTAEFLKINPRGQVPVLMDGETPIREGGAILTYLLDKEKSPLLPSGGLPRAAALEWLMWCNASLHPAYSRIFWLNRVVQDEAQKKSLLSAARDVINSYWDEAEARLGKQAFLAVEQCTIGDILLTVIADWNGWLPEPIKFGPNVSRVLRAVSQRPAYQKALAAEGISAYKAAA
ncbi:MAG: glutathione S-transferase family protein [Alphaproteobacteria bacterium]|nr:glutathione S-transferase family protein [Alphaproteobacteria bacterium]